MVDVHEALRPLVDDPPAEPRPVAEIAARARRRRARRRSATLFLGGVALLVTLRTLPLLGSSGEVTEIDPSAPTGEPDDAATTTASTTPDTSAEPPSTESTVPETTASTTPIPETTESTEPSGPDNSGSPDGVRPYDPFDRLEAEGHDAQHGVTVDATVGGGQGIRVGDGDHVAFHDVDFGTSLATQFEARLASAAGPGAEGLIEVRLHDVASPPFATIHVTGTGGWNTFTTFDAQTPAIGGQADVYVTFTSSHQGDVALVDWFRFQP